MLHNLYSPFLKSAYMPVFRTFFDNSMFKHVRLSNVDIVFSRGRRITEHRTLSAINKVNQWKSVGQRFISQPVSLFAMQMCPSVSLLSFSILFLISLSFFSFDIKISPRVVDEYLYFHILSGDIRSRKQILEMPSFFLPWYSTRVV